MIYGFLGGCFVVSSIGNLVAGFVFLLSRIEFPEFLILFIEAVQSDHKSGDISPPLRCLQVHPRMHARQAHALRAQYCGLGRSILFKEGLELSYVRNVSGAVRSRVSVRGFRDRLRSRGVCMDREEVRLFFSRAIDYASPGKDRLA